jgi:hypothetical protein
MLDSSAVALVPLQSSGGGGSSIVGLLFMLVFLAIFLAGIAGMWMTFDKAGEPGWAAIIPFFNLYVMLKIAGRPAWWLILWFLPILALIPNIMVPLDIAKGFDKGTGFGIGLIFLPFIFYPLLGFGDATYRGAPN